MAKDSASLHDAVTANAPFLGLQNSARYNAKVGQIHLLLLIIRNTAKQDSTFGLELKY